MLVYTPVDVGDLKIGDKFMLNPNGIFPSRTVNAILTRDGQICVFASDDDPLEFLLFSPGRKVYFVSDDGSRDIVVNLTNAQLRLIANWKLGYSANRHATDDECREFIDGAMSDLLSLVSDLWPIQSSSTEGK